MQTSRLENRASKAARIIINAIDKLPDSEEMRPLIICKILIHFQRYGLADLVKNGWDWKPDGKEVV